jgi:hypothetical protein
MNRYCKRPTRQSSWEKSTQRWPQSQLGLPPGSPTRVSHRTGRLPVADSDNLSNPLTILRSFVPRGLRLKTGLPNTRWATTSERPWCLTGYRYLYGSTCHTIVVSNSLAEIFRPFYLKPHEHPILGGERPVGVQYFSTDTIPFTCESLLELLYSWSLAFYLTL